MASAAHPRGVRRGEGCLATRLRRVAMTGAEGVGADPVLERREDPAAGGSAEEEAGRFAARVSWPQSIIRALRSAPGPSWFGYLVIFAALALVGHGASWLGGA